MIWQAVIWLYLGLCLGVLWLLFYHNRKAGFGRPSPENSVESWPRATVIVPVTGSAAGLELNLRSLLDQDYPDFEIIFSVRDDSDPASEVISALITGREKARLIQAGPAQTCSQKNHNLLAGVEAAGPDSEILVFCDSGHLADSNWLKGLVRPLLTGSFSVVSGYHQVIIGSPRLPPAGQAIWVLALSLVRSVPPVTQPWGGATAMTRKIFDDLAVRSLWAETVVDDVVLAKAMRKAGVGMGRPATAALETRVENLTWSDWLNWTTRQWAYLKFVFPGSWALIGVIGTLFTLGLFVCIFQFLLFIAGLVSPFTGLMGAVCLALFLLIAAGMRAFHPSPGPWPVWLGAGLTVLVVAGLGHARTWLSGEVIWKGVRYRVGRGGRVLEIKLPAGDKNERT